MSGLFGGIGRLFPLVSSLLVCLISLWGEVHPAIAAWEQNVRQPNSYDVALLSERKNEAVIYLIFHSEVILVISGPPTDYPSGTRNSLQSVGFCDRVGLEGHTLSRNEVASWTEGPFSMKPFGKIEISEPSNSIFSSHDIEVLPAHEIYGLCLTRVLPSSCYRPSVWGGPPVYIVRHSRYQLGLHGIRLPAKIGNHSLGLISANLQFPPLEKGYAAAHGGSEDQGARPINEPARPLSKVWITNVHWILSGAARCLGFIGSVGMIHCFARWGDGDGGRWLMFAGCMLIEFLAAASVGYGKCTP